MNDTRSVLKRTKPAIARLCIERCRHCAQCVPMSVIWWMLVMTVNAFGESPEQLVTRALGDVFAEDHIVDAALGIHDQAMQLSPEDRFSFLAQWVLPNDMHSTLRLDVGFSPSYPVANSTDVELQIGKRIASGGEIACPALDLIEIARNLNRLDDLRAAVAGRKGHHRLEQKKNFAFQCLIEVAANEMPRALAACEKFLSLTDINDPHDNQHRSDEMLLVMKSSTTPELRDMMVEYAARILGPNRWPKYDDVWSRHFARLFFRISPVIQEDQTSQTLREIPQIIASPKYWTPISYPMAARRGPGMPTAEWLFAPSQVINVANHGDDAVYFNIPLLGDISVEADATVSNWREAEMIVGARWVSTAHRADLYSVGTVRQRIGDFPLARPTTRMGHWYRHRTNINGNTAVVSLDGNVVHRETFADVRDPWIGIRSRQLNEGGARNVRISGSPVIPESIDLIASRLDSWFDYYAVEDPWDQLTWSSNSGQIIGKQLPEPYRGTFCERAVFYHRPMLEDGTIEYEFYFRSGSECAHPAIDRMCFILQDHQVGIHQLTDGAYEQTAADPANQTVLPPRSKPLPLKHDAWNRMQVNLRGDVIQLVLNGEQIAEQALPATNQRFFGVFHFADQEQLRVRNMHWCGDWPKILPASDADELAGSQSDFLDNTSHHLQATFRHDFAKQGLPTELFRVVSGEWGKDLKLTEHGLLTTAMTSRITSVALSPTVGGDFDIFARYTGFKSAAEGGGARLMTRMQNPLLHELIGGRKHMIHTDNLQENVGFMWHGYYENGPYRFEYDKGQNIEETAGTVRLSRRGATIYILTAEDGSENYRLHVAEGTGTEDLSAGGVQLQSEMPGASVVWTELEIHAERLQFGRHVITALNNKRDKNETSDDLDFSKEPFGDQLLKSADVEWISGKGHRIRHATDSEGWSTPVSLTRVLPDDFDIELDFDIETMKDTVPGESCLFAFQIELLDPERTRYHAVLFHESTGMNRLAVHQQCASLRTGNDEGIESHVVLVKTLTGLRIVRHGEAVTMIATSADYGGQFVLAQFRRPLPILPARLNVFVHTGGPNAEISVLLKKLVVSQMNKSAIKKD